MHYFLQSFGAIVGIWTLEGGAGGVAHVGQDLDGLLEHDPERARTPVTAEPGVVLSQGLFLFILDDLYVHLIIRGTVNRSI